ncbi:sphingolipid delta-4 desaturase [Didymella pomorum]
MAATAQSPHVFWEEKISIEPDLGDQRQSTYKALPSPPKTPKRVMMKYRFSGVFPLVLSLATFVLSLVVVLGGQNKGTFGGQYLVALNTSRLGQDVITFEKASATSTARSASASASTAANPLDVLNPLSTNSPFNPENPNNPLNGLGNSLGDIASNLTDVVNDGLGDAVNGVVAGVVNQTGIKDFYFVFVQRICSGSFVSEDGIDADAVKIDDCRSYEEAGDSKSDCQNADSELTSADITALSKRVRSSIVIGDTQVSIPLLARLISSLDSVVDNVNALRKAVLAFLIITMIGSMLSTVSILPAMYFPQSRLLVYFNMFWPALATCFAFLAAILVSAMAVLASLLNGFSDTVGVQVDLGGIALLLVWLSFVFVSLITFYWTSVWFVETRKASFIKRRRDEDEVTKLCGPEPLTKYVVLLVVSIQMACAYLLRDTPFLSWRFFLTAYVVGATANQNLFLAIHEISHNLAFRSPLANRVIAVFANLPIGIPYSASFRPYHLTHHKSLGVNGLDTDLPTAFEAWFLDSIAGKAFFCTCQILFYALRPMFIYNLPLTKIHLFNIVVQLAFDYALVQFASGKALAYLILSSFLAGSLHPCAGHFIAEHYVFEKPEKDASNPANKIPIPETYSYYGILNFFTYNVGLHNEHHDFPAIPWTRLPKLNRIAHEFYDELPVHKSWVYVMWQFVMDKDISLWCRVKREEGGRKVGAASAWSEEELGNNENKGRIPGVF